LKRPALHAAVLVSALLGTLLGVVPDAQGRSSGGTAPHPTGAGEGVSLSAWRACSDPFLQSYALECARLRVPLDYAHPDRGHITLAVTRRPHSSTADDYQGIMLTSPGGPGGSGTWMPAVADYLPQGVGDTYDWIGFDPRGVGASEPALHCDDDFLGADRPSYAATTQQLRRTWLQRTRHYARECGRSAARRLLPFTTTQDTVRDMESLRAALAQDRPAAGSKLNFYGFSYGSLLGEVYAGRYPQRVGRFVLDGVVDPTRTRQRADRAQLRGLERNRDRWFDYLAAHPRAFGLGGDPEQVRADFVEVQRRLGRQPAAGGRLGPDELTDALLPVSYTVASWQRLGRAYAALVRDGNGRPLLREFLAEDGIDDNNYAARLATRCTDHAWPRRSPRPAPGQRGSLLAWSKVWYDAPCRAWPAPHREPLDATVDGPVDGALRATILLVNETQDAVTPYSGALRVRDRFPSARLIAGRDGTTHASSMSGVPCVDDAIAAYLRDGTAPPRRPLRGADLTCPAVEPDVPGAPAAPRGLPDGLQQRLMEAQHPGR
jgi:pimeloyl-ACP methyl ester carboxylesterase